MIPAYKKKVGQIDLDPETEFFNKTLSKARIESEHTIGMLKGRWPFLRQVRFKIEEETHKQCIEYILKYVHVCCILHNLMIDEDDDVDEYDDDVSLIDADNILNSPLPAYLPKDALREELKNYILENFYN